MSARNLAAYKAASNQPRVDYRTGPENEHRRAKAEADIKTWMETANRGDTIYEVIACLKRENEELRDALRQHEAKTGE